MSEQSERVLDELYGLREDVKVLRADLDAARTRAEVAEAKVARVDAVTFAFEGRADTLRAAWQVATGPSRLDAQTSEAIWREAGALTRAALADPETAARPGDEGR